MRRLAVIETLRSKRPLIAPSMLKCDFGNLHREVELLEAAGADLLHLDVMDGHFVPNLTYGPVVIERLRDLTMLPFDAHLMISQPERYLERFLDAGCDSLTVHIEAVAEPAGLLRQIRAAGAMAGLAVNPKTPVEFVAPYLSECDLLLVMSVEPGFGGQDFMPSVLPKLQQLAQMAPKETLLSIDGGIGADTIASAARAGAELFVVGSALFGADDYAQAVRELRRLAQESATPAEGRAELVGARD